MKVLVVSTGGPSMRDEIIGWSGEDSDLFVGGKPIGLTPSLKYINPTTILEAMSMGWKLLSPPQEYVGEYGYGSNYYEWWLTKE